MNKKKLVSYPSSKHYQIDHHQTLIGTSKIDQKTFQIEEIYSFKFMRKIWPRYDQNKIKQL